MFDSEMQSRQQRAEVLMHDGKITSMPTLLAFSRQEAQFDTKLVRPEQMKDRDFLREWLLHEARRGGPQGGGGGWLFGGLFGQ